MIKAVFFDMDGTIAEPNIDWQDLRRQLGIPPGETIMDHIVSLPAGERERTEAALKQIEYEAAESSTPTARIVELVKGLRTRQIKVALITNNHREAMHCVVERIGLEFDLMLSREDATIKPAPDLLLMALRELQVSSKAVRFIGDGKYDRLACAAATIEYIHLSHEANKPVDGPAGPAADGGKTVSGLDELWDYLGL
jgi:HAD superfamily hydrolase (TIGR01549 family)